MWLRYIALAGFCSASLTAHAVDLEAASKAATLVQNAFSCSPPVVVTSSGENTLKTVFEIRAAGDPTWFQVDVISFGTSMRRKDTSASRPIGKKERYTGRLKDLAFATLSSNGNAYLKVTCKQDADCLNKVEYSQHDDGAWRRSGYDDDKKSQVEILSCTARAATALKVGYTTLADFAADRAAPDESAWKEVRALKDALSIRQFLASYPGTALASEAVSLLKEVEAEKGPEKEYGKLVELEVVTFHVAKAASIYPGPSRQFTPTGMFASGETAHSSGKTSNGRVDDEWLEVSFNNGKIGYVERKAVLSKSSYDQLLRYKSRRAKIADLLQEAPTGQFSRHAGLYGFGCLKPVKPDYLFLPYQMRNLYLLDKHIIIPTGSELIVVHTLQPENYSKIALSKSRIISFRDIGSVQLYKVRYIHGSIDYGEIGFAKNVAVFRTGKEIMFTFSKKCTDQSEADVLAAYDWMIDNFTD